MKKLLKTLKKYPKIALAAASILALLFAFFFWANVGQKATPSQPAQITQEARAETQTEHIEELGFDHDETKQTVGRGGSVSAGKGTVTITAPEGEPIVLPAGGEIKVEFEVATRDSFEVETHETESFTLNDAAVVRETTSAEIRQVEQDRRSTGDFLGIHAGVAYDESGLLGPVNPLLAVEFDIWNRWGIMAGATYDGEAFRVLPGISYDLVRILEFQLTLSGLYDVQQEHVTAGITVRF